MALEPRSRGAGQGPPPGTAAPESVIGTDHPRPDLRRGDWLSLDGVWRFAWGDARRRDGAEQRDPGDRPTSWPERIRVPYPWQSSTSLLGPPPPDLYVRGEGPAGGGVGWYQREVELPATWRGRGVSLVIGAAYWHTTVWVDDTRVGSHDGGYEPIVLDLTDAVGARERFSLTVRVWAPQDSHEYPHGKNTDEWYTRVAGIWQSVYLEACGPVAVRGLDVRPTAETGTVEVGVRFDPGHLPAGTLVEASSRDPEDREVARARVEIAEHVADGAADEPAAAATLRLHIDRPRQWHPASPALYDLCVRVVADDGVDEVWSYFGFRDVSLDETAEGLRRLHLNGEPTLVRGVMSQGYDSEGIYTLSDQRLRADLEAARERGFNLVRMHCKVEAPRLHYWADLLGMMLWCEVPNHLTPSAVAKRRWERTWRGMLERDRNHPSVVLWGMFIESWGLGHNQFGWGDTQRWFSEDRPMQAWVTEMYELGRSLDPTRPIIENSVCEYDHTVAEVNDFHLFPEGYAELPAKVDELVAAFVDNAYPGSPHNFADGYRQARQPLMATSCAGWWSVGGVETSWALRVMLNALRREPALAGFGWVQLYDVEWERTGLLDYGRNPKDFGFHPAELVGADVLVLDSPLTVSLAPGASTVVTTRAACASGQGGQGLRLRAVWEGTDEDGTAVSLVALDEPLPGTLPAHGVRELGSHAVTAPACAFAGWLRLEVVDGAATPRMRTVVSAEVVDHGDASPLVVPLDQWSAGHGGAQGVTEVDGSPEMLVGDRLSVELPPGDEPVLMLELAVASGPQRQSATEVRRHPVSVSGAGTNTIQAAELRRDSAGALSQVNGAGLGAYGELTAIRVPPSAAPSTSRRLTLEAATPESQVVVFGRRLGRYPLAPTLRR